MYKALYINPLYLGELKFEKHLQDVKSIKSVNRLEFEDLSSKKSYYFKMPGCGHPNKTTLSGLKTKKENGLLHNLYCNMCNLLKKSNITYGEFSKVYSEQNIQPLCNLKFRGIPFKYKCPVCGEDTLYKELRWVLEQLSSGSADSLCKGNCNSIGKRYPELIPVWDEKRNGVNINDVQATDKNLSRTKRFFMCYLCSEPIQHPTTPYNIIKNQAKCPKHKFNPHTSFAEQAIYLSFSRGLEKLFPIVKVFNKYRYDGTKEFDIFVTINFEGSIFKFAIENDSQFHKDRVVQDNYKDKYAFENNIHLARVREIELKGINLDRAINTINRKSKSKSELNLVIHKLMNLFIEWLDNLGLNYDLIRGIKESIRSEINNVNVLRDELIIFQRLSGSVSKRLLKNDKDLKAIFNQLRIDVKESLGDYITINEQDVKRPFICNLCGREWWQSVKVVICNFRKSTTGAMGCPHCANKEKGATDTLKHQAFMLYEDFYTQLEIAVILNRSQATISTWLRHCHTDFLFE